MNFFWAGGGGGGCGGGSKWFFDTLTKNPNLKKIGLGDGQREEGWKVFFFFFFFWQKIQI